MHTLHRPHVLKHEQCQTTRENRRKHSTQRGEHAAVAQPRQCHRPAEMHEERARYVKRSSTTLDNLSAKAGEKIGKRGVDGGGDDLEG
jgi:hypothetical protein